MGTRTRTVMFTDLADYTAAVSRSDREGVRRILQAHEDIVRPIVVRFGGRVVKNLGDSFMCMFDAATDALRCALDIQDTVAGGDSGMRIRIGMTTGDVEEIDGDAFGDAVNQAARVLAKAPAGEVWFGPGSRVCMNSAEIPWEPVGRMALKGIPGEVDLYRAVASGQCRLPEAITSALKRRRLQRVARGASVPTAVPRDGVLLLEGFLPGSAELQDALARLPTHVEPAQVFLVVYHMTPADRHAWVVSGRGLVVGRPEAVEREINAAMRPVKRHTGSDTLVLDLDNAPVCALSIAGLALPSVPLSDVVAAYAYDLLPDGTWSSDGERAVCRVEVESGGAFLRAVAPQVTVDGRSLPIDGRLPLRDGTRLRAAGGSYVFHALADGYVGVILGGAGSLVAVHEGETIEIGREPSGPGLAFPDRKGGSNVRWCPGSRAARARAGGFTLDRALAGRRQASVDAFGADIRVTALHERCPTWLLREGSRRLERVVDPQSVAVGDHVVAGTNVIAVMASDDVL